MLNLAIEGLRILLVIIMAVTFVRGLKGYMEFISARLLGVSFYENFPRTLFEDPMMKERYDSFNAYLSMFPALSGKALKATMVNAIGFVTSLVLFYILGVYHAFL